LGRGKNLEKHSLVSEEEIKILINMGLQEGVLEEEEEKMLTSIIEFGDIVVREIMTPRMAIVAVDVSSTVRKVVNVIKEHWHSRLPVFSEKMDNIVGFIYAKDLLAARPEDLDDATYIKNHMRDAFFVPESKRIDELLKEMKKEKKHVSMVVDEYGGICGLVTIEDIIEEIVGEIQDEYDGLEDDMLKKIGENIYIVSGLINVTDLNDDLGTKIPEADNYDSLAGYIVDRLGKLPAKGDLVEDEYLRLTILHVASRRITKVKLEIKPEGADNSDS
jgi:putative hemolysin